MGAAKGSGLKASDAADADSKKFPIEVKEASVAAGAEDQTRLIIVKNYEGFDETKHDYKVQVDGFHAHDEPSMRCLDASVASNLSLKIRFDVDDDAWGDKAVKIYISDKGEDIIKCHDDGKTKTEICTCEEEHLELESEGKPVTIT